MVPLKALKIDHDRSKRHPFFTGVGIQPKHHGRFAGLPRPLEGNQPAMAADTSQYFPIFPTFDIKM